MAKFGIREATSDDVDKIKEIFNKVDKNSGEEFYQKQFENNLPNMVMEIKGEVVGYYSEMMGEANNVYIMKPMILPEAKEKTLKTFFKEIKKQAKDGRGVYKTLKMTIQMEAEEEDAIKLVKKQGYEATHEAKIGGRVVKHFEFSP